MSGDREDDVRSRSNEVRGSGEGDDADDAEGSDGEHEWRFAVDDVGPDGVTEDTGTPPADPIEPESIDLEHTAFVVLGVALTVGVLLFGF